MVIWIVGIIDIAIDIAIEKKMNPPLSLYEYECSGSPTTPFMGRPQTVRIPRGGMLINFSH